MYEIIKVYKQQVPALRFIGKKYGDSDRENGWFTAKWDEWSRNKWFDLIDQECGINVRDIFEEADASIGLLRVKDGDPFEYWIGKFMPAGTPVPDGFDCIEFPASTLGVCWVYGKEENEEIFGHEPECAKKLEEAGYPVQQDKDGVWWHFERYVPSRMNSPDEKGNVILDICYFI